MPGMDVAIMDFETGEKLLPPGKTGKRTRLLLIATISILRRLIKYCSIIPTFRWLVPWDSG